MCPIAKTSRQDNDVASNGPIKDNYLIKKHMETQYRTEQDFVIISVTGNIVLEETVTLKEKVEEFIEENQIKGIIINGKDVKFIDSSGLGLIVSIYKTLTKRNKKFGLTNLNTRTMEIFILTKLDKILTITETDQEAIDTLSV